MLQPTKISSVSCLDRLNYIHSLDNDYAGGLTEQLRSSFEASPDYVEVYRNYNYNKTYKTRIFEGNEADKKAGFKYLQSYPYDTPQFQIGDYIHWNYDHIQLSTWLMISLDTQHLYDVKGRMMLCNNHLKWIDNNGTLYDYDCVFDDTLTYASFRYSESGVIQTNGTIVILVHQDDNTRKIYKNQRFLFNGTPYVVNNFIRSVNPNIMEIYMFETQLLKADDIEHNIAFNATSREEPIEGNETVITPSIQEILEGDIREFTIQRYINGIPQEDVYTITTNDVPDVNYTLNITGDNKFTIENKLQYTKGALTINCFNQTTAETTTIELWLVGGW